MLPDGGDNTFEILDASNTAEVLISAEHAGNYIPKSMDMLGLPSEEVNRHIGWDIGIDSVARHLHETTGLPAILGRYSRLIVDLNRPADSPECIVESSDGTRVPGNFGLSSAAKTQRIMKFHRPFHDAFRSLIDRFQPKAIVSIHSFTPMLRTEGVPRKWHCGVLYGDSVELAQCCLKYFRNIGDLVVGDNEPYRIERTGDYTIPVHGDGRGIPVVLIEIRQDLIGDAPGQLKWAQTLCGLFDQCLQHRL